MKRFLLIAQIVAVLATAPTAEAQQVKGRFGFEYNEVGFWAALHHEQLLAMICEAGRKPVERDALYNPFSVN